MFNATMSEPGEMVQPPMLHPVPRPAAGIRTSALAVLVSNTVGRVAVGDNLDSTVLVSNTVGRVTVGDNPDSTVTTMAEIIISDFFY
jgi:hypothetical protein